MDYAAGRPSGAIGCEAHLDMARLWLKVEIDETRYNNPVEADPDRSAGPKTPASIMRHPVRDPCGNLVVMVEDKVRQ